MITKPLFILLLLGLLEHLVFGADTLQDCQEGNKIGFECVSSTNPDKVYPPFIDYLDKLLDDHPEKLNWYGHGYRDIGSRFTNVFKKMLKNSNFQLHTCDENASINYKNQMGDTISYPNPNRINHEWCNYHFFWPIIGVIALYQNPTSRYQPHGPWVQLPVMDVLINQGYIGKTDWEDNGVWVKKMTALMKKALTKVQAKDESNLFTREMIYTKLNHVAPKAFPLDESPFQKYQVSEKWYNYVKNPNVDDENLRGLFDLTVDGRVVEFCQDEPTKSLLCSFVAAKNKYDFSLLYLPKNPSRPQTKSKHSTDISISAYYGQDGLYATFKSTLDDILKMNEFKATVDNLGNKLSKYFGTLAEFDNKIAKADVDYVKSAIEKNNERLETNVKKMNDAVQIFTSKSEKCTILNFFEIAVQIAFAIAVTVATGGAAGPAAGAVVTQAATTATTATKAFKTFTVAVDSIQNISKIVEPALKIPDHARIAGEFDRNTKQVAGAIGAIMANITKNKDKIDAMDKIAKAVNENSPLSPTQGEVKLFLDAYTAYEPTVTKTDLAELNHNYTQTLDSFVNILANAGFLCKLFLGKDMSKEISNAKFAWNSINTLLEDIVGQQFELIGALVKVVRSKLDMSASKQLQPGTNYNFEIVVRHMLDVRVAAQQFCDTYRLMNNDVPEPACENIKGKVFLSDQERKTIMDKDKQLRKVFESIGSDSSKTNQRTVYIPISGEGTRPGSINWDDLINHNGAELILPTNEQFLKDNGWINFPKDLGLLKSLQLFLPNVFGPGHLAVQFTITAIQDHVTVNQKPNPQRYTIKPLVKTSSEYTLNEADCRNNEKDDVYVKDQTSRYCIPIVTGHFNDKLRMSLPVSMYSKFHILLNDGLDDAARRALRNEYRPFGDTLTLRGMIQVYANPAGGFEAPAPNLGKHRTIAKSRRLEPKSCEEGQYLRVINRSKQTCTKCPDGSHAVANGSYCAVNLAETAVQG